MTNLQNENPCKDALEADHDWRVQAAAHQMKTLLWQIHGYANLLSLDPSTPPDECEYVRHIRQNAAKLCSLIDYLLKPPGIMTQLDMGTIVGNALLRLAPMIDAHHPQLNLTLDWPEALGYTPWVEEIWVNYISNAIKYGGMPPRLWLGATLLPDGKVCFWVRDNGPGIPTIDQARLFTPGTRLEPDHAEGHGWGLYTVRRLVESMGGSAAVESVIGHGSTFSFTLPGVVPKHDSSR